MLPRFPFRRLVAAVTLLGALAWALPCPSARGASWARPVLGAVTRGFDVHGSPFAAGLHRGVDLAAPPGTAVGAPCGGRVVVAGRVGASGRVVTVACGPWHATVLPLASVAVRRGAQVRAGRFVGTAAGGSAHAGIHLGVRRASDRFGYVDPLRLLPREHPWVPVAPPAGRARRGHRAAESVGAPAPLSLLRAPVPVRVPASAPRLAPAAPTVAPWPVWAGAALMLAGAATGGVVRVRARRASARVAPGTSTPLGRGWGG
ncbi:MAG TPA: M23 family metallopeptidase [Solirubrobacteraceae bacterium]|nr:M23 family metallopeptidase [Solirubrobacteraceae bacterium]